MRSRKTKQKPMGRQNRLQTAPVMSTSSDSEIEDEEEESGVGGGKRRFFGCYLLTSLSPRYKGHSYIGYTVNPKRRIRQHNGEISSGAFRTKKKRPWEMVLCIHGFPTNIAALQFEWAWQHPMESTVVRVAAASFKTLGGLANKIKLALTMLTLNCWQSMELTVSFFSTKYMKHIAGCPSLPLHMKLHFCSMDELPCYLYCNNACGCDNEDDFDSHAGEVSGNLCGSRLECPDNGLTEKNPPSIHIPCGTQKASENMWASDHGGVVVRLERGSSSIAGNGAVEEHMEPFYQLPADVHDSALNTTNEPLQLGEEICTEDAKGSFCVLEEDIEPLVDVDASMNDLSPILKNHIQPAYHLPADGRSSIFDNLNEHLRLGKEVRTKEPRCSFPITEEPLEPFPQTGPFEKELSSTVNFVSVEDVAKVDTTCVLIEEIPEEWKLNRPTKLQSPIRFADTLQSSSTEGIKVIDLLTPSPDCKISAGSKHRRIARDCPEIIDLTRSPPFV